MKVNDEYTIIKNGETPKESKVKEIVPDTNTWRSVLIGGVPGIMLGSAGTIFASNINQNENIVNNEIAALKEEVAVLKEEISELKEELSPTETFDVADMRVAHGVNENMSFSEAFATARAEVGPNGVFSWHGNVYVTFNKDEWYSMSDSQRDAFVKQAISSAPISHTGSHDLANSVSPEKEMAYDDQDTTEDGDVKVLGGDTIHTEDGHIINVLSVGVDGHYGEVYDINNDGTPDAALLDVDDDGRPDVAFIDDNADGSFGPDEVYSVDGSENTIPQDDALYDGMPDYTNDADISNFA